MTYRSISPLILLSLAAAAGLGLAGLAGCPSSSHHQPPAEQEKHLYSTWNELTLDRCASLWLIKRYVDAEASFRFFPKHAMNMTGTTIDTPTSTCRRTHKLSCFEVIMTEHNLDSPELEQLAKLVHAGVIDYWHAADNEDAKRLHDYINGIIRNIDPIEQALEDTFAVFDHYVDEEQ